MDELERKAQEEFMEEKLTNDEMLHDEELETEAKREKLLADIQSIKLQLMDNKLLENDKKAGKDVKPRDEAWVIRARQALLIKKGQLRKTNKKIKAIKELLYK